MQKYCHGEVPLDAREAPWIEKLRDSDVLHDLVDQFGSPLNIICDQPFRHNVDDLRRVARSFELDFEVFFARKANKCLTFVDAALQIGCGIDTASETELEQALQRSIPPDRVICTAAIKSGALIVRCVEEGVVIAVDNADELQLINSIARRAGLPAFIALRIGGFQHEGSKLESRFGFDIDTVSDFLDSTAGKIIDAASVNLIGIHFHLDGYCRHERASAIRQSLKLIDDLRDRGHHVVFLDIGGGFPMSYIDSESRWNAFWREHRKALLWQREEITFRNHGLGFTAIDEQVVGKSNCYPSFQQPIKDRWFQEVLGDHGVAADNEPVFGNETAATKTIADSIRQRGLQLRCEPGRSVLDNCGFTVARVEFRKQQPNGDWLIGLSMNRTQCRTTSDDFLVDPILMPKPDSTRPEQMSGYLVGAYCTEKDLILLRRLRFPLGVAVGDLIVFPNTAGYLMHFMESRSHQFPLAKNLVFDRGKSSETGMCLDAIDL